MRDARSDPQTRQHGNSQASHERQYEDEHTGGDSGRHSGNHRGDRPLNCVDEPQFLTDKSASLEVPETAESKCHY